MTLQNQMTTLPGGIRVVSETMPHVRSLTIGAWINSGSRDENDENNGVSHFLEHMVFKETARRNTAQIAESLESVGGNLNAFTGKEFTCYFAHVLDEHAELAVDIVADLICSATLSEDEIVKERLVILEEISSLDDTPDELIHEYFHQHIFEGHKLGRSILGSEKNVLNMNREHLDEYRQKFYTQKNIVIAAAGNIEHEELVKHVRNHFELPVGEEILRANGIHQGIPGQLLVKKKINQAHVCLGNHALSYLDPRKYTALVLHALIGGGMSSRLFQNVREKHGVAYTIYSFTDFYLDTGLFGVYIGVDKGNIDKSLKLIHENFDDVINNRVKSDELERFKSQLKGSLMLGLENTYSRMSRLAKMELYLNKYVTLDDVLDSIDAVSADDLQTLACEILKPDMYTAIITPG